jgi:hypothetical protein
VKNPTFMIPHLRGAGFLVDVHHDPVVGPIPSEQGKNQYDATVRKAMPNPAVPTLLPPANGELVDHVGRQVGRRGGRSARTAASASGRAVFIRSTR